MKVLFITEKYVFCDNPSFGLTNNTHNLIGSWECTGYGRYKHIYISPDPGDVWSVQQIDDALLNNDYDMAVISPYDMKNCSQEVARKIGHKLVLCWWDCITLPIGINIDPVYRWWDYGNLGAHNLIFDYGNGEIYNNTYGMEVPQDTRIFCRDKSVTEDLDISFIGALRTRGDRMSIVNTLKDAGFNVWAGGGRGPGSEHDNLSVSDYAMIHKRSKICLNIQTGHGKPQRKGRTFEIGAVGKLMLTNNISTFCGRDGCFFDDGKDCISFDTTSSLIDNARYYLDHENERNKIADQLYTKYYEKYSPNHFWAKVLNMCGLTV